MVSVTLSGISGKGGCSSLFIWDVGLGTEVSMRKIFAHLGVLGLAGCPHSIRRWVCACQCPLLHQLVSLVLLTGCSRDLGEGHRKATTLNSWGCTGFWIGSSLFSDWEVLELDFWLFMGNAAPFIWSCCFLGLSKWIYLVPEGAKITFMVNCCILAKVTPLKCSK